jgi:PBP1b-binding outer membrane lipoprotein LpoB
MRSPFQKLIFVLSITGIFLMFIGCQTKKEEPIENKTPQTTTTTEAAKPQPVQPAQANDSAIATPQEKQIPQLVGTWSGTLFSHPSTLIIKTQNGNEFTGSIVTKTRQETKQNISGKFDPQTLDISMRDLLHSRFMGNYTGKLSADGHTMQGQLRLTQINDSPQAFSFTKK